MTLIKTACKDFVEASEVDLYPIIANETINLEVRMDIAAMIDSVTAMMTILSAVSLMKEDSLKNLQPGELNDTVMSVLKSV